MEERQRRRRLSETPQAEGRVVVRGLMIEVKQNLEKSAAQGKPEPEEKEKGNWQASRDMILSQKLGWFSGLDIEVLVTYISDFEKTAMNRRHLYYFPGPSS